MALNSLIASLAAATVLSAGEVSLSAARSQTFIEQEAEQTTIRKATALTGVRAVARGFQGYSSGRAIGRSITRSTRSNTSLPTITPQPFSRNYASRTLQQNMSRSKLTDNFNITGSRGYIYSRNGRRFSRTNYEAHHIVPFEARNHNFILRARRGGFNFNGSENGVVLPKGVHAQNHIAYNRQVIETLNGIEDGLKGKNINDRQAASILRGLVSRERQHLQQSSGMN